MATNLENKIGRIQANVTNALSAISGKGVAVPPGANSDDLEELIENISQAEDLSAELAAQDALITQLEEAIANKASGGGGGTAEPPNIQPLTITENGTYTASGDVDGYSPITVEVPETEPVLETLAVTKNGTYTPSSDTDGFSKVVVNVPTSGGSSAETCVLSVDMISGSSPGVIMIYQDVSNVLHTVDLSTDANAEKETYVVKKNSVVIFAYNGYMAAVDGDADITISADSGDLKFSINPYAEYIVNVLLMDENKEVYV